jgi:hypothetical protein
MLSERQLAANRRNAQRSTGPSSRAGKQRASRNAFRHGLTSTTLYSAYAHEVEEMTRKIAGDTKDERILTVARDFAAAELELARVRRVKVALIERTRACGALKQPPPIRSLAQLNRFLENLDRGIFALPERIDPAASMPSEEPYRSAEAVRRVLPELLKLNRYERRASIRRDEAARRMLLLVECDV